MRSKPHSFLGMSTARWGLPLLLNLMGCTGTGFEQTEESGSDSQTAPTRQLGQREEKSSLSSSPTALSSPHDQACADLVQEAFVAIGVSDKEVAESSHVCTPRRATAQLAKAFVLVGNSLYAIVPPGRGGNTNFTLCWLSDGIESAVPSQTLGNGAIEVTWDGASYSHWGVLDSAETRQALSRNMCPNSVFHFDPAPSAK